MRGVLVLSGILVRRNRVMLLSWSLCLVGLIAVTVPSYAVAYPSLADRGPIVAQMRDTVATKVLYGPLPTPGTLGQLAQWETGTYLILLAAVLGILLGARLGRVEEEAGTTELFLASGASRRAPAAAAMLVLAGTFGAIGTGTGAVLAWQSRTTAEVTAAGAWHLGAVVAVVGLGFGLSTSCFGQVLPTASAARAASWTVLAAAFVVRVVADLAPAPALRWLTWFGLRDLVSPFTRDRTAPLALGVAALVVLGLLTVWLTSRRELGGGFVPARRVSSRPAPVSSSCQLAWRLGSLGYLGWIAATVAVAALFGGMSHSLITVTANDANTSAMIATLTGRHDPTKQYFALSVIFIALIPLLHAVAGVLRTWSAETTGLLDVEVATGVQRWRPLAAQAVLSSAQVAGLLVIGALVQSALAAAVDAGGDASRWALWTVLVQAPGAATVVGITTMLVGLAPRRAGAAWLTVAWSAFAALLGGLVRLPEWARRYSLLGLELHDVPGPLGDALQWRTAALFTAVGLATAVVGVSAMRRRDIVSAA